MNGEIVICHKTFSAIDSEVHQPPHPNGNTRPTTTTSATATANKHQQGNQKPDPRQANLGDLGKKNPHLCIVQDTHHIHPVRRLQKSGTNTLREQAIYPFYLPTYLGR